jgi:hypothetical protein
VPPDNGRGRRPSPSSRSTHRPRSGRAGASRPSLASLGRYVRLGEETSARLTTEADPAARAKPLNCVNHPHKLITESTFPPVTSTRAVGRYGVLLAGQPGAAGPARDPGDDPGQGRSGSPPAQNAARVAGARSMPRSTSSSTPGSARSTGSSAIARWQRASTNPPAATRPPCRSQPSTTGCDPTSQTRARGRSRLRPAL